MVFGDDQFNSVIQIYSEPSRAAIATKFGTKRAVTRLLLEICEIFASILYREGESFGVGPSNAADEILPRPTLVAMATIETK